MARNNTRNNQTEVKPGVFSLVLGKPLSIILRIVGYLFLSIVFGTLLEWTLMFFVKSWGYDNARKTLIAELNYLGDNFTTSIFGMPAYDVANRVVAFLNQVFFGFSPGSGSAQGNTWFLRMMGGFGQAVQPYIHAFFYVVMITSVRFVIVVMSAGLFIVIGIAAAVDGLHMRELRKLGGGVEHASIYHHAKATIPKSFTIAPVLYLAWPTSVNPNFILLPGMAMFFLAVLISFATFKKYL